MTKLVWIKKVQGLDQKTKVCLISCHRAAIFPTPAHSSFPFTTSCLKNQKLTNLICYNKILHQHQNYGWPKHVCFDIQKFAQKFLLDSIFQNQNCYCTWNFWTTIYLIKIFGPKIFLINVSKILNFYWTQKMQTRTEINNNWINIFSINVFDLVLDPMHFWKYFVDQKNV